MRNAVKSRCLWLILFAVGVLTQLNAQATLTEFIQNLVKKHEKGLKIIYKIKDDKNGFYQFCATETTEKDCTMESNHYDVAMWKTESGSQIFGYFRYDCGGEGCSGALKDIHFFDNKGNDITNKVCPMSTFTAIDQKAMKLKKIDLPAKEPKRWMFKMPQKGTTIPISVGQSGIEMPTIGALNFNKKTGVFIFVKAVMAAKR